MRRAMVVIGAVLGGAAICARGADLEYATPAPAKILSTDISGSDLGFLTGVAPEIALMARLADLGKKQAVTPEIQAEAVTLSKEQTDSAARLTVLAAQKNVPLDAAPDEAGLNVLHTLGKLTGVRFDKSFLDAQGDAADALETSLEAGATSSDADIKAFAQAGLGTLKQERERVRKLGL